MDWIKARHWVAEEDLYTPHTWLLEAFYKVVNTYEKVASQTIRNKAQDWAYEVLQKEDEFTNFICIGKKGRKALIY